MEFYHKLSSLRKEKGLSQEEIADRLGVSRQAVSKWENGQAMPETANIIRLCEIFEVTPNDFFGYTKENYENNNRQKIKPDDNALSKKPWYKSTPFKVFVAVLSALLAVRLITFLAAVCFGSVFFKQVQNVDSVVHIDEIVSVSPTAESGRLQKSVSPIRSFDIVNSETKGTKKTVAVEFVPHIVSNSYEYSLTAIGKDGKEKEYQADVKGGVCRCEIKLSIKDFQPTALYANIKTDTQTITQKLTTITDIDETSVAWD